jgi:mRNA interferase MazF
VPKGDILLISFPFTDLSGNKLRPAVVLSENHSDYTLAFITSQVDHIDRYDVFILMNKNNGLKKNSIIKTTKIATVNKSLAKGLLGKLNPNELLEIDLKLKAIFDLL